ncbi:serine/threonine-protein kinase [Chloroflexota bacterium]
MSAPCPNCGRVNRAGARYCASCQTPLDASTSGLQPGRLLDGGTYRVLSPLGKGGMGAVYLVAQTKAFDRPAVVKEVIDYFDPTDPEARKKASRRFEAEARTLGDLRHPGIPDLYAYFTEGGHNFLVMEYIEGPDLRGALTREDESTGELSLGSRLAPDDVIHYTIQVCEVLEYLGSRNPPVVHNDIKPGNIIVDEHSGRAVLVDFGTAKTRYLATAGQPEEGRDSVYGTVGYAAPELYKGHSEPRSDVYSLAATAYHLLTDDDPRDHPFQYPELDSFPAELSDILRAALAEETRDRPVAAQFRQQLARFVAGQTGPLQALTFPDGESADDREELLVLAVKHWRYATGILQDGTVSRWLRGTQHDPAAAKAAEEAVRQWPNSPDAALEAFVRKLDPTALAPGRMEVRTPSIRLTASGKGQQIREKVEIANTGGGYLRGEILSTQPWIKLGSSTFACSPGRTCAVPVVIDTTGLEPGTAPYGGITLTPNGGPPEVVSVQVAVVGGDRPPRQAISSGPTIHVQPDSVDFGEVLSGTLSTPRRRVTVTNVGGEEARCQIRNAPSWLLVKPEAFRLAPGDGTQVDLVGRVAKVKGRKERVDLKIALDDGPDQRLPVSLRIRGRGWFS